LVRVTRRADWDLLLILASSHGYGVRGKREDISHPSLGHLLLWIYRPP
jgi:hypothetical protein